MQTCRDILVGGSSHNWFRNCLLEWIANHVGKYFCGLNIFSSFIQFQRISNCKGKLWCLRCSLHVFPPMKLAKLTRWIPGGVWNRSLLWAKGDLLSQVPPDAFGDLGRAFHFSMFFFRWGTWRWTVEFPKSWEDGSKRVNSLFVYFIGGFIFFVMFFGWI